jgi:hypothetical protein
MVIKNRWGLCGFRHFERELSIEKNSEIKNVSHSEHSAIISHKHYKK